VPDARIKANHPSPPQTFLLTDVQPRTPRASWRRWWRFSEAFGCLLSARDHSAARL